MANKELTALPTATLAPEVVLYAVDANNNSRKVSLSDLAQYIKTAASIVPASNPWKGARVKRTANLSISSSVSNVAVTWSVSDVDTSTFWSAGAPTRLTIPAGVTRVRLRANVRWDSASATGIRQITLFKNGATLAGRFSQIVNASAGTQFTDQNAASPVLPVTAGDYFELIAYQTSGAALNIVSNDGTWFEIEVAEGS